MRKTIFIFLAAISLSLFIAGCSSVPTSNRPQAIVPDSLDGPISPSPRSGSFGELAPPSSAAKHRASERPGLATVLAHDVHDDSTSTQFFRKQGGTPDAIASFHYNDERGAKAMADLLGGGRKCSGTAILAGRRLKGALARRYSHNVLPSLEAAGKRIFIGNPGRSYEIYLSNPTSKRIEVVVSVDGLDVMSAKPASFSNRGYVIDPHSEIAIEGMMSGGRLKSLQFGSVADSEAAKSGGARNVGVIGIALFEEDETAAKAAQARENLVRTDARAFSGE